MTPDALYYHDSTMPHPSSPLFFLYSVHIWNCLYISRNLSLTLGRIYNVALPTDASRLTAIFLIIGLLISKSTCYDIPNSYISHSFLAIALIPCSHTTYKLTCTRPLLSGACNCPSYNYYSRFHTIMNMYFSSSSTRQLFTRIQDYTLQYKMASHHFCIYISLLNPLDISNFEI